MKTIDEMPDYDRDHIFENIDLTGIRCLVIIISTFLGAGLGCIGLAIYYFIINNF